MLSGAQSSDGLRLRRVTSACSELVNVTGAGLALMTDDENRHIVRVSDPVMGHLEDLQLSFGEGPGVDAFTTGRPALEPDLADPSSTRWLAFGPAALDAGARAVFALPLQVGVIRLGTLDLYRTSPGMLSPEQMADGIVLTDLVTEIVLDLQGQVNAGSVHNQLIDDHGLYATEIHQATGMVAAHLAVSVKVALARLRGHAFAEGISLAEAAAAIVDRRLRLE
jgi:hypothetical protein